MKISAPMPALTRPRTRVAAAPRPGASISRNAPPAASRAVLMAATPPVAATTAPASPATGRTVRPGHRGHRGRARRRLRRCPRFAKDWKIAKAGFGEGSQEVGKDVKPGTYVTTAHLNEGRVSNCYW